MASGYSLTSIRQYAAREAGRFHVSTVTGGTTTSTLEDTSWPFNSSIAAGGLYKDYWTYTPASAAADQVRLVKTYTGTGGTALLDTTWAVKPSTGAAYELHGMFPPAGNANSSWLTLVNEGLKLCVIPVEYSLNPPNNTDNRFPLATAIPWLSDPLSVRRAGVLAGGVSRNINDPFLVNPIRGQCTLDGTAIYLDCYPRTFQTTDTIYLTVMTPAYFAIQAAGSGPFTQVGMALETDVAPVDNVEYAAFAALVVGWRRFSTVLDQSVKDRAVNSLAMAVSQWNEFDPQWPQRYPLELKRKRRWGPSSNGAIANYVSGWSHG